MATLAVELSIFAVACIFLVTSGSIVLKSLVKIASTLKIKEFIMGAVLVAFFTSIPELFVGISASLKGLPDLIIGTIIGSNISDLTLVIGTAILFGRGLTITDPSIKRNAVYMTAIAALPIILMLIGNQLSRIDGVILLMVFVWYIFNLIRNQRKYTKELNQQVELQQRVTLSYVVKMASVLLLNSIMFIVGVVLLFFSAELVTEYAIILSMALFLPPILIGLFFVALGTSLPELVFEIRSVLAKHGDLALGDIIGSVVANSALVLGIAALINPIQTNFLFFVTSATFMIVMAFLFMAFVENDRGITWREGLALLLLYTFFIIMEVSLNTVA